MSDDKFATFTKNNYTARRTDYSPKVGSKGRVDSNRCVIISIAMLFLCVAILVLCVISAWIFFALEANNCKAAENAEPSRLLGTSLWHGQSKIESLGKSLTAVRGAMETSCANR